NLGQTSDVLFGAVQRGASDVEFQPDDGGEPITGTIVPTPPSLGAGFDLFFLEGAAGLTGDVVAAGIGTGNAISPAPSASPSAGRRGSEVELSGTYEGHEWRVVFMGAFTGSGSPCIEVTIEGPPGQFCPDPVHSTLAGPSPHLVASLTQNLHVLAGSVSPEIVEIRFTSDDGTIAPTRFSCRIGPSGWIDPDRNVCAVALPPQGSGTFEYLDAHGNVLFEEGRGWGAAEPDVGRPAPVDPIHGGTYWAVYVWLGSGTDPDSERAFERWSNVTGGKVSSGDLACDEGAAEALGTTAASRVAAYFESQGDATAFAREHGLLGHEADPVIARVTTYCLD
ncbi:MAG: hypothetical protein ACRELC_03980, partial [Gemmatimonadota bacterium]